MLLPIVDPSREKELLERDPGRFTGELAKGVGGNGRYTTIGLRARIIEVYRRCHEQSAPRDRATVLRDFAANFPQLTFQAEWTRELVKSIWTTSKFSTAGPRSQMLRALANGFRAAANPTTRQRRLAKMFALEAAREFRANLSKQLDLWETDLKRSEADVKSDWLEQAAKQKAMELVAEYPSAKPFERDILRHLLDQRHYDVSILITAKTFSVSARELGRRPRCLVETVKKRTQK